MPRKQAQDDVAFRPEAVLSAAERRARRAAYTGEALDEIPEQPATAPRGKRKSDTVTVVVTPVAASEGDAVQELVELAVPALLAQYRASNAVDDESTTTCPPHVVAGIKLATRAANELLAAGEDTTEQMVAVIRDRVRRNSMMRNDVRATPEPEPTPSPTPAQVKHAAAITAAAAGKEVAAAPLGARRHNSDSSSSSKEESTVSKNTATTTDSGIQRAYASHDDVVFLRDRVARLEAELTALKAAARQTTTGTAPASDSADALSEIRSMLSELTARLVPTVPVGAADAPHDAPTAPAATTARRGARTSVSVAVAPADDDSDDTADDLPAFTTMSLAPAAPRGKAKGKSNTTQKNDAVPNHRVGCDCGMCERIRAKRAAKSAPAAALPGALVSMPAGHVVGCLCDACQAARASRTAPRVKAPALAVKAPALAVKAPAPAVNQISARSVGLPPVGSQLVANFGGKQYRAIVRADGLVVALGKRMVGPFQSLSTAGKAVTNRPSCEGTRFWRLLHADGSTSSLKQ